MLKVCETRSDESHGPRKLRKFFGRWLLLPKTRDKKDGVAGQCFPCHVSRTRCKPALTPHTYIVYGSAFSIPFFYFYFLLIGDQAGPKRECSYSCFASIPGESDGSSGGEQDNPTEALFLSFLSHVMQGAGLASWRRKGSGATALKALLRFCHWKWAWY